MARSRLRHAASRYFELPLARLLARLHISANAITLAGLVLSGGTAYLLSQGWFLAGGLLLLLSSLTDTLDGAVARLTGTASASGAFLDSLVDRLSEAAVLLGLLVYYIQEDNTGAIVAVYLALVFSYLVSYLRARAEGLGSTGTVGLVTRPERIVLLAVGLFLDDIVTRDTVVVALWAIVALSALTAAQRLFYVLRHFSQEE